MSTIDFRALRSSVFIGALVGAVIGFALSGTLRASSSGDAEAAATTAKACSRSLCENVLWLRTPVLNRVAIRSLQGK